MSYRYRQSEWSGGELGIHVHGYGDEDGHRYRYRNILPLHTIVDICGHTYADNIIYANQCVCASRSCDYVGKAA